MRKAVPALCVLLLVVSIEGLAPHAAAMPFTAPAELGTATAGGGLVQRVHCGRRCALEWPRRHYWQWGDRPAWDDPWVVLRPNFWGSPEPHLVPADIWACKWHLPPGPHWRRHRRQCPTWQ